ncbi:MAG: hypothetical protein ABSC51_03940 [Gaiellaceae bacterium]
MSYLSPRLTDSHQGYATDGTYHYLFGTNSIYKRNDDATWSLVAQNRNANSHLLSTHLGDGDYYNGNLYVPSELYRGCRPGFVTHQSILVFRASDLSRVAVHDISAQGHEVSSVAVAPDIGANGTIFASDYCNPFYIYKYDLHSFAFLGGVHVSHKIFLDQGLAYRDGLLYASSDGRGGRIYVIDPTTGAATLAYKSNAVVAHWEGIDYSQSTLRRTLFFKNHTQKIQYLSVGDTDPTPASRSFTVDVREGKIFAYLAKNTFTRSQAGKVRLVYRFSPSSERFHYVLSRAHGASWLTVRTVTRSGDFEGSHSITIKALFASKPIENGRYRLMLSAEVNRKVLAFEIQ